MAGDEEAIGMLPTTLLHLPFKWAVVAATVVAAFLLIFEFSYYSKLDQTIPENAWVIGMGILRDGTFVLSAFEVLAWYRITVSSIRRDVLAT